MSHPRVLRVPANSRGRDMVVGDIHGTYDLVIEAMKAVGFDQRVDRIFSVGDLIDRGPHSERVVRFLSHPWVFAVKGNHESMLEEIYQDGEPDPAVIEFMASRNGFGWWKDALPEVRDAVLEAVRPLPYVIELETARGVVGLVHADVPKGMDWQTFTAAVEAGDPKILEIAVWGRDRLHSNDDSGIEGIGRVFVGHTPVNRLLRLSNVYAIDTGAVYRMADIANSGALTFIEACSMTNVITSLQPMGRVSVAEWNGDRRPFSPV